MHGNRGDGFVRQWPAHLGRSALCTWTGDAEHTDLPVLMAH